MPTDVLHLITQKVDRFQSGLLPLNQNPWTSEMLQGLEINDFARIRNLILVTIS